MKHPIIYHLSAKQVKMLGAEDAHEYEILASCLTVAPLSDKQYARYLYLCDKAGVKAVPND